jgi:undecaprenyl-diphosphatase
MNRVAVFTFIAHRDHNLMRRINRWPAPRWIRIWMICATRGGDGWLWYGMGLIILLFGGDARFAAVAAAALAAGIGITAFLRLKKAARRKRPNCFEPHCWATLLPPDQFSFPSGHTITAFAVAVSLSMFYPTLAVGLLFCALSVGASRILLGMHFLSDVLAGALIGAGLAYLSVHAVRLL